MSTNKPLIGTIAIVHHIRLIIAASLLITQIYPAELPAALSNDSLSATEQTETKVIPITPVSSTVSPTPSPSNNNPIYSSVAFMMGSASLSKTEPASSIPLATRQTAESTSSTPQNSVNSTTESQTTIVNAVTYAAQTTSQTVNSVTRIIDPRLSPLVGIEEQIDLDQTWAGHPVGYDLLTEKGYQFVAYYNLDRYITIASRRVDSNEWTTVVLNSQVAWDSHNYITTALDDNGYLHVAGNMHGSPLTYFRSKNPWNFAEFEKVDQMTGLNESQVTYPRFMRGPKTSAAPDGLFLFSYRQGSSGNGETYYNVYDHSTKTWSQYLTTPLVARDLKFRFGSVTNSWKPVAGDWNGDGKESIGLYDSVAGKFYLKNANQDGSADLIVRYGPTNSTWLPVVGDWNGDGIDTIGLYSQATGTFYLRNSNTPGNGEINFRYGPQGKKWIPVIGDWNGDGKDTIGLYDPVSGTFYLRNSNTAGVGEINFRYGPQNTNWIPAAGDWNGDRTDSIGLYDPVAKKFFLKNANSAGVADLAFGYAYAGTPIVGDWTRSGFAAIGTYDNTAGMTYLRNENSGLTMNAYASEPLWNETDQMYHMYWVWRNSGGAENTHDLYYARSRDLKVWEDRNGNRFQDAPPFLFRMGDLIDPIPINGGLINGGAQLGFDSQNRPIITYTKYDQFGYTQAYAARLEMTSGGTKQWRIYAITQATTPGINQWQYRWNVSGSGSLAFEVRVGPATMKTTYITGQTVLTMDYSHIQHGSRTWILNEDTLTPVDVFPTGVNIPPELAIVESSFPGMQAATFGSRGSDPESDLYLLRWERLGVNGDQPRNPGEYPAEGSPFRLYKLLDHPVFPPIPNPLLPPVEEDKSGTFVFNIQSLNPLWLNASLRQLVYPNGDKNQPPIETAAPPWASVRTIVARGQTVEYWFTAAPTIDTFGDYTFRIYAEDPSGIIYHDFDLKVVPPPIRIISPVPIPPIVLTPQLAVKYRAYGGPEQTKIFNLQEGYNQKYIEVLDPAGNPVRSWFVTVLFSIPPVVQSIPTSTTGNVTVNFTPNSDNRLWIRIYWVQVASDANFTNIVHQGFPTGTFEPVSLTQNGTYYVRVRASATTRVEDGYLTPWSNVVSFSVNNPLFTQTRTTDPIPDQTMSEGQSLSVPVSLSGFTALQYSAKVYVVDDQGNKLDPPSWMRISSAMTQPQNPNSLVYSFNATPGYSDSGIYTILLQFEIYETGEIVTQQFTLTILDATAPPPPNWPSGING